MRARGARGAAWILMAGSVLGLPAGSARAEAHEVAPGDGEAAAAGATPDAAGARSRRDPGRPGERQAQWWAHAREVLFTGLELSPEQSRGVDAIIEGQVRARKRAEEIRADLEVARRGDDAQRTARLREELRASRRRLKSPHAPIEEMRELLSEEQRPTFDMNRARLVAEGRQSQEARQGPRARRSRAGPAAEAR
jgi:hypothetical protein